MKRFHLRVAVVALLCCGLGCDKPRSGTGPTPEPAQANWFTDITEQSGLYFIHDTGPAGRYDMTEIMGSGAALLDYDGDGRLDVYLIQNAGENSGKTNRLFHQEPDGRFRDVSAGSGLDVAGRGMGVAVGDVNNDGRPDVLVAEYGRIRLFLNNGNGTFIDVTRAAGLDNPFWAVSAAFVDYDRDGWLDLVVVNYVDYDPNNHCTDLNGKPDFCGPQIARSGSVTKLFHNLGHAPGAAREAVRFDDVTMSSGLGRVSGPGMGVLCADFDGDGWPDIFVTNDGKPNHLWMNRRDGTFREEAVVRGVAYNGLGRAQANMGIAFGDVSGNGLMDLYVTHLNEELGILWQQGPRGMFQDRTTAAGLASPLWQGTGFGTVFADFDNSGALGLAVVNGAIKRSALNRVDAATAASLGPYWSPYAHRNQLFANDGHGRFRDVSPANKIFCGAPRISRGLVCGDIFNTGAQDLLVTTIGGPARLYRNSISPRGHWLVVRAIDPALGGRDAYGAEITVVAGGRRWVRWINPGSSYASSNDPRAHFGFGAATQVESIAVTWPDGACESFPGGAADRLLVLRKGDGTKLAEK